MTGEVAKFSDSDNILHLVHVGANDGKYHEFVTGRNIIGDSDNSISAVTATSEDNKIAENEQNDDFETIADGFLDFTESNPFGDPNET